MPVMSESCENLVPASGSICRPISGLGTKCRRLCSVSGFGGYELPMGSLVDGKLRH